MCARTHARTHTHTHTLTHAHARMHIYARARARAHTHTHTAPCPGLTLNGTAYTYTSAAAFSYDGGGVDDEQLVTFNSTRVERRGVNETLTRAAAMQRLRQLQEQIDALKTQMAVGG